MFEYDLWSSPPQQEGGERRRGGGDPAVGGNWVATLADVSRAFDTLPTEDQDLLRLRYDEQIPPVELAARHGVSRPTIDRRVDRALTQLQDALGGAKPWSDEPEPEYTGAHRTPSNAAMRAALERSYQE